MAKATRFHENVVKNGNTTAPTCISTKGRLRQSHLGNPRCRGCSWRSAAVTGPDGSGTRWLISLDYRHPQRPALSGLGPEVSRKCQNRPPGPPAWFRLLGAARVRRAVANKIL